MNKTQKGLLAAGIALLLVGLVARFGVPLLPDAGGPFDKCIVVYESQNQPVSEVSVMGGVTANALRKADLWRQFDKDAIPDKYATVLNPVIAKQGIPCIALMKETKVLASGKLPATDADLAAFTKRGN
jgi:hypothetical protein